MAMTISPDDVQRALEAIPDELRNAVSRWEIAIDEDWSGDPATHVRVLFKDAELIRAWPQRNRYRDRIRETLWNLLPDRIPYVLFSGETQAANPEPSNGRRR